MNKLLITMLIIGALSVLLMVNQKPKIAEDLLINQTNMQICKSTIFGDRFPVKEIKKLLINENALPKEYLALKSASFIGMSYFLLINYEKKSLVITYFSQLGLRFRTISIDEGNKIFSMLVTNSYKNAVSEYGNDSPHPSCEFIKIKDTDNSYFLEILNGGENLESPVITIRNNISKIIDNEYGENYLNANGNELERVPSLSSDNEINEFNSKLKDDIFYELNFLDK